LVLSPPNESSPALNNLNGGFAFFREPAGANQVFKLTVGTGTTNVWFDGGLAAQLSEDEYDAWHHFAFTISQSEAAVYIDGEIVSNGALGGVNWTGTDLLSIMSGAPNFVEWSHMSDESLMDELRIFDKALTQEQ